MQKNLKNSWRNCLLDLDELQTAKYLQHKEDKDPLRIEVMRLKGLRLNSQVRIS
jgi:hypothetical protein